MSLVAVCALLVRVLAGDGDAAPAAPTPTPASGPRRLSVSLAGGFTWGGPASGIEAPLRAAGYDDTFYGCLFDLCSGPTSHPSSDQDEDPFESWTLGLRYLHDPRFGVALLVARTPLQVTDGFRSDTPDKPSSSGEYAHMNSEVTVVAALATVGAADVVWVGVGPSVNLVTIREMWEGSSKATTVGVVAEAGLRWPPASRAFFQVNAQYRWAASAEMGLFEFAPTANVSASHTTLAVGVGVRLGGPVGRQRN